MRWRGASLSAAADCSMSSRTQRARRPESLLRSHPRRARRARARPAASRAASCCSRGPARHRAAWCRRSILDRVSVSWHSPFSSALSAGALQPGHARAQLLADAFDRMAQIRLEQAAEILCAAGTLADPLTREPAALDLLQNLAHFLLGAR